MKALMAGMAGLLAVGLLAGCATTYEPPNELDASAYGADLFPVQGRVVVENGYRESDEFTVWGGGPFAVSADHKELTGAYVDMLEGELKSKGLFDGSDTERTIIARVTGLSAGKSMMGLGPMEGRAVVELELDGAAHVIEAVAGPRQQVSVGIGSSGARASSQVVEDDHPTAADRAMTALVIETIRDETFRAWMAGD